MTIIICISQDHTLQNNLTSLYGSEEVFFLKSTSELGPDLIKVCDVMIIDLKDHKIPAVKGISFPIIALTSVPNFQEATQLLQYGIRGYGNRKMRKENLAQAIENAKEGQLWLPPSIVTQLISTVGNNQAKVPENKHNLATLSKREAEVANYIAAGMSNQEIADKMFISLRTVKAHLSSIYSKTGLRNRLELGLHFNAIG